MRHEQGKRRTRARPLRGVGKVVPQRVSTTRGKVGGKRRKEKKARKTNYCWSSDAWRVRLVGGYVVEWFVAVVYRFSSFLFELNRGLADLCSRKKATCNLISTHTGIHTEGTC